MIRIPLQSIISESVLAIIPEISHTIIKLIGGKSFVLLGGEGGAVFGFHD